MRMLPPAILLLGMACSWAVEPGVPALDPLPRIAPLAPLSDNPAALTPEQRLQRRLDAQVHERDQRIAALLAKRGGARIAPLMVADPKLTQPRHERDQAWEDLQHALHSFDDLNAHAKRDILDVARPAAQSIQQAPLSATNQLRIAECYHDLAVGAKGATTDIADGLAALDRLDAAQLPDSERPRCLYLRAWFLAEQARLAAPEQRPAAAKATSDAVQALLRAYPDSELAPAASALLIGLEAPAPGAAP